MKFAGKLSLGHFELKRKWIHVLLIIGVPIFIVLSTVSCIMGSNPSDEYYVKYEVNSSTIYMGGKLDMTINTETNEPMTMTINQRALSETIIGPVQKGFNASLEVVAPGETHNQLKLYTNIYVSKNDSPFALKKSDGSDTPRDNVQLNYTIDY